jgi:hypothetical protein
MRIKMPQIVMIYLKFDIQEDEKNVFQAVRVNENDKSSVIIAYNQNEAIYHKFVRKVLEIYLVSPASSSKPNFIFLSESAGANKVFSRSPPPPPPTNWQKIKTPPFWYSAAAVAATAAS